MILDKQVLSHTYILERDDEDEIVTVEVVAEYPVEQDGPYDYDAVETYLKTPAPGIDREGLHRIIVDQLNDRLF